jgi:hypothetical protein
MDGAYCRLPPQVPAADRETGGEGPMGEEESAWNLWCSIDLEVGLGRASSVAVHRGTKGENLEQPAAAAGAPTAAAHISGIVLRPGSRRAPLSNQHQQQPAALVLGHGGE